jgi:micrococcal nuclease
VTEHWTPTGKIVGSRPVQARGPWGSADDYLPRRRRFRLRRLTSLILGTAFICPVGWLVWQNWPSQSAASGPAATIEWNAVQAVPTRAPDAEDVAWQQRAQLEPSPSWGGLSGGEQEKPSAADAAGPPPTSATRAQASGRIYVIDGDTFSYRGQRLRIAGMDAPETHPPRCAQEAQLGLAATEKLRSLLSSGSVTISGAGRERYGRELRTVQVNGVDVAELMISAGLASSYSGGTRQSWC